MADNHAEHVQDTRENIEDIANGMREQKFETLNYKIKHADNLHAEDVQNKVEIAQTSNAHEASVHAKQEELAEFEKNEGQAHLKQLEISVENANIRHQEYIAEQLKTHGKTYK